jgi:hypothetical protein
MAREVGLAGAPDVARLQPAQVRQIAAVVAVPTITTIVLEWTLLNPGNPVRALAAIPPGTFLVLLVLSALAMPRRPAFVKT